MTEQTDGGRKMIEQLDALGVPVTVAFWERQDGDDRWQLYVVTPEVDRVGPREVYTKVRQALTQCRWENLREEIDPDAVHLLPSISYRGRDVARFRDGMPGPSFDTWRRTNWAGGAALTGLFVYGRLSHPAPAAP